MKNLTFTTLLPHIQATYPERSSAFHFIATRFYLGAETEDTLATLSQERPCFREKTLRPLITMGDAVTMVENR